MGTGPVTTSGGCWLEVDIDVDAESTRVAGGEISDDCPLRAMLLTFRAFYTSFYMHAFVQGVPSLV